MFLINCPNCGPRNVAEFRFGGELHPRPEPGTFTHDQWQHYLYARRNEQGVQKEWWYHRMGCRQWFLAQRHTKTNQVLATHWYEDDPDKSGIERTIEAP